MAIAAAVTVTVVAVLDVDADAVTNDLLAKCFVVRMDFVIDDEMMSLLSLPRDYRLSRAERGLP